MGSVYPDPAGQPPGYYAAMTIAWAESKRGAPYQWGAAGPNAFDCSGLVYWSYQQAGYPAGPTRWTTATIATMGQQIPNGSEQPGDLVMPTSGHVGICVGNGYIINAPENGIPVREDKYTTIYQVRRLVTPITAAEAQQAAALGVAGNITSGVGAGIQGGLTGIGQVGVDTGQALVSSSIIKTLAAIGTVVSWIMDPKNIERIATGMAGVLALGIGAYSIAKKVQ